MQRRLANTVLLKREDLQPIFSFKIRGAYNKIAQLSREQLAAGVVACSAGNHAQGVALSAVHLGIDAIIIMPKGTPAIKVDAVRKLRGNVRLHGDNYDEAQAEAMRLVESEGRTLIHPFDDPLVIAGQGTIGAEILKQTTGKPLHAVFVCCGGGGMLAGIAAYIKRVRPVCRVAPTHQPRREWTRRELSRFVPVVVCAARVQGVLIIGVEAEDAAGMTTSLRNGQRTALETVGLFADGAAVRMVGQETFRVCNELVDDMVTVTTDEICVRSRPPATAARFSSPQHPPQPPVLRRASACLSGGDQGRVHGDALRARAGGRAGDCRDEAVGGVDQRARPHARRHRERRQHGL
jgi:threonine dehydratase